MVVASGKSGSGGGNKADSLWDSDNDSITVEVVVWWITMVLVATAVTNSSGVGGSGKVLKIFKI